MRTILLIGLLIVWNSFCYSQDWFRGYMRAQDMRSDWIHARGMCRDAPVNGGDRLCGHYAGRNR